jgi:nicotinate-nucleotide adenylyltransferase
MTIFSKRIGLLFGSFNPIHIGHLIIAETVAQLPDLKEVWLVVSPHNPLKDKKSLLNQYDRLHLARLAIENNNLLRVSDIEFGLPQPSYTIDTLAQLHEKYPQYEFCLIMGEDNLAHLHKWKNYEQILKYYRLIVYPRPNCPNTPPEYQIHERITWLQVPLIDISATHIRHLVQNKKSIRYLVPEQVREQIASSHWWQ